MSSSDNQNLRKRIDALEARLANQERAQRAESQRAIGFTWPRERWLARTTSASPTSYPSSGDTFQVELLSGYFTAAEGTQAVTESLRGTKPMAHTWPETYLPYGTKVIAERIRGVGPEGAGEWWIQAVDSHKRCVIGGEGSADFVSGTSNSDWEAPYASDYDRSTGLWTYPWMQGMFSNASGRVFRVRSSASGNDYPTTYADPWLYCYEPTWYRVTIGVTWALSSLSGSYARSLLMSPAHQHGYTDDGVPRVTDFNPQVALWQQAAGVESRAATVHTEIVPSRGSALFAGKSSIQHFFTQAPSQRFAHHTTMAFVRNYAESSPLTFRIRSWRSDAMQGYAQGQSGFAQITSVVATAEQVSGPL